MLNFQKVKEKRNFPRVKEDCKVNYSLIEKDHFLDQNLEGIGKNISGGGMCFHSETELKEGAMLALEISKRTYVMELGEIVMQGDSADLAKNDDVRKAFLGE